MEQVGRIVAVLERHEPCIGRRWVGLEEALAGAYARHAETIDLLASSLNNLGYLYHLHGRYQEAEPLYLRAQTLWEQLHGAQHPTVATLLDNLGRNYQFLRDEENALIYFSLFLLALWFDLS